MYKIMLTGASGGGSEVSSGTVQSAPTNATAAASDPSSASLQITSHKCNGKNFLQWSTSVQMVIRGRGKLDYLTGSKPNPAETDPSFHTWDAENSFVMAWLINSMREDISSNFMLYPTAKSMWDAVNKRYSDLENSTQMCDLRDTARNLKQGDLNVTDYYNMLTTVWQELDLFNKHNWKCQEDAALYRSIVKERIYDFVFGLNKDLDEVRGRTLALKPLPHIDEIFAEVRREESRKQRMLGGSEDTIITDNLAMVARSQESSNSNESRTGRKSGHLWCDYAVSRITLVRLVGNFMVDLQIGGTR